jgi:hypothetical protein
MVNTELHTILTAGNKPIPKNMQVLLQAGFRPGTVRVQYKLPGQKNFSSLGELPIVDGVLILPVKLLFLSYAHEDQKAVEVVAEKLYQDGFMTWLDKKDIRPGDSWKSRIKQGMDSADYVLIFLSKTSSTKKGYVQAEMKYAFEQRDLRPDGQRYIIPVLLEDFVPPDRFADIQWVDLSEADGYERLKTAFED